MATDTLPAGTLVHAPRPPAARRDRAAAGAGACAGDGQYGSTWYPAGLAIVAAFVLFSTTGPAGR